MHLCSQCHLSYRVKVTPACVEALRPWRDTVTLTAGVLLGAVSSRITMTSDASLLAWRATLMGRAVNGIWDPRLAQAHINVLELWAVFLPLRHFQQFLQGQHVLINTDNSTAVAYINRQRGTRTPQLHKLGQQIVMWSSSLCLFRQHMCQAVTGEPSLQGVDSPSSGSETNLAEVQPSSRRSLRLMGKHPLCTVHLPVRCERTSGVDVLVHRGPECY